MTEFDTIVDLRVNSIFMVVAMLLLRLGRVLLLIFLVTVLLILFVLPVFVLVIAQLFVSLFAIFLIFLVLTIFLCWFVIGLDGVRLGGLLGDQIEVPFNFVHILAV